MLGEEAGDLLTIADELERRALTHEKVIAHLDLPHARVLRELARRIRKVVDSSEGDGDRDAVHGEVVGLRLEAMCALLEEPAAAAPPISSSGKSPSSHTRTRSDGDAEEIVSREAAVVAIGRMRRRRPI